MQNALRFLMKNISFGKICSPELLPFDLHTQKIQSFTLIMLSFWKNLASYVEEKPALIKVWS